MGENRIENSSFRDNSGFLFYKNNVLFRQINNSYKEDYDLFMQSGLYSSLIEKKWIVFHKEVDSSTSKFDNLYKVIKPENISFISYPFEHCFSQLKDMALLTLKIQKEALKFGMILKDASLYNVQWRDNKPIFIDTLSFEKWKKGEAWIAYGQFCRHFLAPLLLMVYRDISYNKLLQLYIDGIPLDFASKNLPTKTKFFPSILTHIHLHASLSNKYSNKGKATQKRKISVTKQSILGIVENLKSLIQNLKIKKQKTEWNNYYQETNYQDESFKEKANIVASFLDMFPNLQNVWDIGANSGYFSRIASKRSINVISSDIDSLAVEKNYLEVKKNKEKNIYPLLYDACNPSPSIGWENKERKSIQDRAKSDMVFALALIHHLAISNNVPLKKIAHYFSNCTKKYLVIEWVEKGDSQVQKLLSSRKDIFTDYTEESFTKNFKEFFKVEQKVPIKGTLRVLYLMQKKDVWQR